MPPTRRQLLLYFCLAVAAATLPPSADCRPTTTKEVEIEYELYDWEGTTTEDEDGDEMELERAAAMLSFDAFRKMPPTWKAWRRRRRKARGRRRRKKKKNNSAAALLSSRKAEFLRKYARM